MNILSLSKLLSSLYLLDCYTNNVYSDYIMNFLYQLSMEGKISSQ